MLLLIAGASYSREASPYERDRTLPLIAGAGGGGCFREAYAAQKKGRASIKKPCPFTFQASNKSCPKF
jgi:hypothetical protein